MDGFQSLTQHVCPVTLLIASPAVLLRCGLKHVLQEARPEWALHEVDGFDAAVAAAARHSPDVILIDGGLVAPDQLSSFTSLRGTRLIVMGDEDSRSGVLRWLGAGAHGYLMRSANQAQLICAIDTVMLNNIFAPSVLMTPDDASPDRREGDRAAFGSLTDRQREVLELIMQGHSTKAIARDLDIAVATVKIHLAAIYRSLGARSRLEALVKARQASQRSSRPVSLERASAPGPLPYALRERAG